MPERSSASDCHWRFRSSSPSFPSLRLCAFVNRLGSGSLFRIWGCLQDRQFCHADTKRTDAIHGLLRIPECGRRKNPNVPEQTLFTGIGVGLFRRMPRLSAGHVQRRSAGRILHHRCSRLSRDGFEYLRGIRHQRPSSPQFCSA